MKRLLPILLLVFSVGVGADEFDDAKAACQRGDRQSILNLLEPLAKEGDNKARYCLARLFSGFWCHGEGDPLDEVKAMRLLRAAAEQGYAEAEYFLALWYYKNEIGDDAEAQKLFLRAAEHGSCAAMVKVGDRGPNNERFNWYFKAAQTLSSNVSCLHAMAQVAKDYLAGNVVPRDPDKALFWQTEAADLGWTQSQLDLGRSYFRGDPQWGIQQSYPEAARYFRMAAEFGNPWGQLYLGDMYLRGQGTVQNFLEAAKWYKQAALHKFASAQISLADLYRTGRGVEKNLSEAYVWYSIAAAGYTDDSVAKKRDAIARELDTESINKAQATAQERLKAMDNPRAFSKRLLRFFREGDCY